MYRMVDAVKEMMGHAYPELAERETYSKKVILAEEAKRIKNDNVNSAFFQTSVRVWPQYGRVEIRGVLKTWIGDSKPFTDIKHYILILKRENGVTWLDNFGETDDEKK